MEMPPTIDRAALIELLDDSAHSQSDAAAKALRTGASFQIDSVMPGPFDSTLCVYEIRWRHLQKFGSPHAFQLANSVQEFLATLKEVSPQQMICLMIQPGPDVEHHFCLWIDANRRRLVGCLKTISRTEMSDKRWQEIWGEASD